MGEWYSVVRFRFLCLNTGVEIFSSTISIFKCEILAKIYEKNFSVGV